MTVREQTLSDEIRAMYGVLLTRAQVETVLNVSRKTAEKWLTDVPAVTVGGRKRYRPDDVALKIERSRT